VTFDLAAGLEGRGVIVTGAGGGIGREVARAFASAGARVLAVDLRREAVEAVVAELDGDGHAAAALDLSDLRTHGELVARARRELGELYVLAHLAAVLRRRPSIDDVTEEDWDVQLDVNLKAAFFLCRASAQAMVEQGGGGRIIAFTSQGWQSGGFGGSVAYAASKGGIVSMARGLARTYGPHAITVNTVSPGLVDTPMLTDGLSDEVFESLKRQTPLGRVAQPHELAGTVVFLASQHAGYISGATINVSGGFLMY
jgi:NAD(P)-dependent dehydrogenase (short-subunit alcohol dehydrogenase family)